MQNIGTVITPFLIKLRKESPALIVIRLNNIVEIIIDAINEIVEKLESYGYGLRVCQCCKYFDPDIDGSVNQVKGFCKYHFANRTPGDILPTVLWNSCEAFDKMNIVNMFDAIAAKKQEEKNK